MNHKLMMDDPKKLIISHYRNQKLLAIGMTSATIGLTATTATLGKLVEMSTSINPSNPSNARHNNLFIAVALIDLMAIVITGFFIKETYTLYKAYIKYFGQK